MKKIFITLIICLLTMSLFPSAFAAEVRKDSIDVKARYEGGIPWCNAESDANGNASVTLPDGTIVTVSGIKDGQWRLVVDKITEKDALDYISGVVGDKLTNPMPLHIFLIDESGNIKNADGITVTITTAATFQRPAVYALSDAKSVMLSSSASGSSVTFTTNGSSVYVLGDASQNAPSSPKTGDSGNILPCFALLIISGSICTALRVRRTKRG